MSKNPDMVFFLSGSVYRSPVPPQNLATSTTSCDAFLLSFAQLGTLIQASSQGYTQSVSQGYVTRKGPTCNVSLWQGHGDLGRLACR